MTDGKKNHDTRAIDCAEAMRQLFDYLDGEVEAAAHEEIHRHLDGCRSCFSRVEFEKALKARVRKAARSRAPDSLKDRLDVLIRGFAVAGEAAARDREPKTRAGKDPRKSRG